MGLVTYHIEADHQSKLREVAKLACHFWNRFIDAHLPVVIRLGKFTSFGNTIARAYRPYTRDSVVYGRVEFNTRYLDQFSQHDIVATVIHEIGHTLGIGWSEWMDMFSHSTGRFYKKWTKQLPDLANMLVETDYGPGTTLVHWDEDAFERELMSGFKSENEYVLPVTIEVMSLLGHHVIEQLEDKKLLSDILSELEDMVFSREGEAVSIKRDLFIETEIWEEVYDHSKVPL